MNDDDWMSGVRAEIHRFKVDLKRWILILALGQTVVLLVGGYFILDRFITRAA